MSIQNRSELSQLSDKVAEAVELRFDLLKETPGTIFPMVPKGIKVIATCRPGDSFSEQERISLLSESVVCGADYVDIEIESGHTDITTMREHTLRHGCALIISWHDFKNTPDIEELAGILSSCYEKGADVAKIATFVNTELDMINLLSLYKQPGRKIVIGMGRKGVVTRIAAPLLGAEFTFAAASHKGGTAPGQLTVDEINTIYKILNRS
jgi:3-dehydroquinate dehydratase type I